MKKTKIYKLLPIILIAIIIIFIILKLNDNNNFELDSKNKYTIITDMKWNTLQNDGGSNTSIYYQIDLDNNTVNKIKEDFQANLGETPKTDKSTIYTKKINSTINKNIKKLFEEILTTEDINENNNYNYFTILNMENEKNIYNTNTIEKINTILKQIDEL